MKSYKYTIENELTQSIYPTSFEIPETEKGGVVKFETNKGDTTDNECEDIIQIIKNTDLMQIGDNYDIIEVLKGACFVKKRVVTEYTIVDGEGKNLIGKINDEYLNYLAGYGDGKTGYIQKGDQIIKTTRE